MGIGGGGAPAKLYREIHGILFVVVLSDMFVLNGYDVIQYAITPFLGFEVDLSKLIGKADSSCQTYIPRFIQGNISLVTPEKAS